MTGATKNRGHTFKAVEAVGRTLPDVEVTTAWGQPRPESVQGRCSPRAGVPQVCRAELAGYHDGLPTGTHSSKTSCHLLLKATLSELPLLCSYDWGTFISTRFETSSSAHRFVSAQSGVSRPQADSGNKPSRSDIDDRSVTALIAITRGLIWSWSAQHACRGRRSVHTSMGILPGNLVHISCACSASGCHPQSIVAFSVLKTSGAYLIYLGIKSFD